MNKASEIQQFALPKLDYDPGHIDGHIVLKSSSPCFEERDIVVGYVWEEEDFGGYMGPRRIQVPVFEKQNVFIGYKYSWQVCSQSEYESFTAAFN